MLAGLATIIIILGCAAHQYLKGSLVKSFVTFMTAVCAVVLAFSYFELLAKVFFRYDFLVSWAQGISLILIFILSFAVLCSIAGKLIRQDIYFMLLLDRISAIAFGVLIGFIISGTVLTSVAMMPLPAKWPYQRFYEKVPSASQTPKKALLNADGFVTGLFSMLSKGSLSGKSSFAVLHPSFLDQIFLNRHPIDRAIEIVTGEKAIIIPRKNAAWPAPENLLDVATGQAVGQKPHHMLTIVRVGIKPGSRKNGGAMDENHRVRFTLSQLRLICKEKNAAKHLLAGSAKGLYPTGYLRTSDSLQKKPLNEEVTMESFNFTDDPNYGKVRWLDLAFYVPNNFTPVLVQFKQNALAKVPRLVQPDQAPKTVPFIQPDRLAPSNIAKVNPVSSAKIHGIELAAGDRLLEGLSLKISTAEQWQKAEKNESGIETQFDGSKVSYARTKLIPLQEKKLRRRRRRGPSGFNRLLSPYPGYLLVSLKCNNPAAGAAINADQFPELVDLFGEAHHPVGLIAAARVNNQTVYEVDYCSLSAGEVATGLVFDAAGSVAKTFPDTIRITAEAQKITELYMLYLIKPNTTITSVKPGGSKTRAALTDYEGFPVK